MGLDMTLKVKSDFSNPIDGIVSQTRNAIVWRKANQIHRWFMEHCAPDGCEGPADLDFNQADLPATHTQLVALRDLCKEAYKTENPTLLPPCDGFYFGSTDLGEYYWDEIDRTEMELTALLNEKCPSGETRSYFYHPSW